MRAAVVTEAIGPLNGRRAIRTGSRSLPFPALCRSSANQSFDRRSASQTASVT